MLQEINGYDGATGASVDGFGDLKRRLHRVRLLDLLRRLSGAGRNRAANASATGRATDTAGDSPGRPIAASSTTAPRRDPTARRGASARSWSGGTTTQRRWTGLDTPDFTRDKPPDYRPPPGAAGDDALAGDAPFIMHPDGLGWIWVPSGLKDGPLPAHYEPLESPSRTAVSRSRSIRPRIAKERPDNRRGRSPDRALSRTCSRPIG